MFAALRAKEQLGSPKHTWTGLFGLAALKHDEEEDAHESEQNVDDGLENGFPDNTPDTHCSYPAWIHVDLFVYTKKAVFVI